jgi:hypothetical protein
VCVYVRIPSILFFSFLCDPYHTKGKYTISSSPNFLLTLHTPYPSVEQLELEFSFRYRIQISEVDTASYPLGWGVKLPEHETSSACLSCAEITNAWNFTSTRPHGMFLHFGNVFTLFYIV